ncbi:MAG: multifunctional CCA addition/repair protein [Betaproteobacteria bacterium]|nr:multifunctional CCA addition/repair protein [Betaproteobacteria bacterium]
MKIYTVGGSVRDELLGLPVQDHDYVVIGATPEQMLALGYKPVGADFPVFLHPDTHEEYALARTERKTAPGYKGFVFHAAPNVSLEEDLQRRDLTINAIARDLQTGEFIDPYGGQSDLIARRLRHVGPAFTEDPVRILRVARFAARFAMQGFVVADETLALMQQMVDEGEVDHLVAERVWQELARGLMEPLPSRMFETLRQCGALARILPEVDRLFGVPQSAKSHPEIDSGKHTLMVTDCAARLQQPLSVRFAALTHDLGKGGTAEKYWPYHPQHEEKSVAYVKALCERLRVPNDCRSLAETGARWHGALHRAQSLNTEQLLALFEGCDALRRPERFHQLLALGECDHRGRAGYEDSPYAVCAYLATALAALQTLDQGAIARAAPPTEIADAIRKAKLDCLLQFQMKAAQSSSEQP